MSDVKCATMLIRAAERDIAALWFMRDSGEICHEVFGFHVQQAAEKMLKAHLALLGVEYPLTHNIEALLDLLAERGITPEPFGKLIDYTPYAVEFRYQGVGPDAEPIDREGALRLVEIVLEQVTRELARDERE
ncbi:MAG: HEPN domain-containing protein [Candidatus Latescibacteria bacterium]|nr:HEPN domain-containing protein [Candidatus Latescibacterota bacterium]